MSGRIGIALLLVFTMVASGAALTPAERRAYRDRLLEILPASPEFAAWVERTDELPPDFDSLPRCNLLPDPLTFEDGRRVLTREDWAARRAEILALFEHYVFGTLPPDPVIAGVDTQATDHDGYARREVVLHYGPEGKATMHVSLVIPDGEGPMPALVGPGLVGGFGNAAATLLRRGYVAVGFAGSDFDDDTNDLPSLYPEYSFAHYGGANVTVDSGEAWTRVIGPFLMYVNEGTDPLAMWHEARARADIEAEHWPYDWVDPGGYARPKERSTVSGRLVLKDPLAPRFPGKLMVGLAQPTYRVATRDGRRREISWQTDAKHYQFWTQSDDPDGTFTIENVSPGTYMLYAFAEGVLGEFTRADVVVGPGATLDLGALEWTPVRKGRQFWEVGVPNRTAAEFAAADGARRTDQ
jgi:hypothetical protein